ncbi:ABC transporter ATP-binding protein [Gluconobacter thailandicus]|uniref:ABC transporter ATP-binding protein n=1 Tax=Gluconobacter thailandicus TaxID=257438 RepID=UPI000586C836|nr:ABC transporter ATP-binding protein [Gluconobacter thailandicus]
MFDTFVPSVRCINICKSFPIHRGVRSVLNNVNFTVEKGQKLGIMGRNGAGKSTLIKIIGGVEFATSGSVERNMSVSWPLAFGGAFQGSLSGLDNLRFICRIYGLDYSNTRAYVDDFAQLGRQLAEPVKTYSSGMRARLAFALSIVIEFDCYLIDEVIMVGDARFLQKCQDELFQKRAERSLIIVSHDMGFIREHCNVGALLHDTHFKICENVADAIEQYEAL